MPDTGPLTLQWSPAAVADVQRIRAFIEPHNAPAARHAAASLKQAANTLLRHPGIGKRVDGREDRELLVPFGQRGYVIRYRLAGDAIVILRIWHGLEDR
jgi:plasmid stabilization system protein ParE